MPVPNATEITIKEDGREEHESWLLVRANHITSTPGAKLFDSEIAHVHLIRVTITRASRTRDLNRDWLYGATTLMEFDLSQAQWGAFVSSFGQGLGVPATLTWLAGVGQVPGVATNDSRLAKSHDDVREAGQKALESVQEAHNALVEAFESGAGKKVMRDRLAALSNRMNNLPSNMEYAAKTLTEHTENVVAKARADIEGMAMQAVASGVALESNALLEIEQPDEEPHYTCTTTYCQENDRSSCWVKTDD